MLIISPPPKIQKQEPVESVRVPDERTRPAQAGRQAGRQAESKGKNHSDEDSTV